jgi:hypothetical protein
MTRYGIRVTLPAGNPLLVPHLLGSDWEYYRWFDTEVEREQAWADMTREFTNYRQGNRLPQVLERVERED